MIQVRIASQVTAQGVSGVRWVLVEQVDAAPVADAVPVTSAVAQDAIPAADGAEAAETTVGSATAGAVRLGALKLLVVALGLAAALWTAHVQVGPPGADGVPTRSQPQSTMDPAMPAHAVPARPGAVPVPPAMPHAAPPATSPATSPTPATAPDAGEAPSPAASASPPRLTAAL